MQHKDLPERWKSKIADYLHDNGKEGRELNTDDFKLPMVDIKFKGHSYTGIERALVIDAPEFDEVVIFTEKNEYHIFNSESVSTDIIKPENEKDFLIQKLQKRNEQLNQFILLTAFDLKAPIRTAKNFAHLLQRNSTQLSETHLEYLNYIIKSCIDAERLLLENLDKAVAPYKRHELECVNLSEILSKVKKDLAPKIEETGLTMYSPINLPKVLGQKAMLIILFNNFIDLSIKCIRIDEEAPSVWIDWQSYDNQYLKISIKDNGIGIEEKYQSGIFDPFYRGPHDTSPYNDNFELGVCKKIIIQYGGEIWVESEKGVGTTFFFTLKLF